MVMFLQNGLMGHIMSLAKVQPHLPALLSCDEEGRIIHTIDYSDLYEKLQNIGSWFESIKLSSGDTVALAMHNRAELLLVSWAAWSLGIITAPLDVRRDAEEQHLYKIGLTKPKLLLGDKKFSGLMRNFEDIESISSLSAAKPVAWKKGIEHPALILFTSGTTSHPKGAKLSLKNLMTNADGIRDWFKITEKDRFLVLLPLHHINSTSFTLATILGGASIAIPPAYSSSKFWSQLANSQSTFTSIVPTICFDQLSQESAFKSENLHVTRIQIGSAPVIAGDAKKFIEMYKIPLYQGYGQTETALRVTGVPLDLDKKSYSRLVDENSIGKPMKWADVIIMGKDGKALREGEEGELAVKGDAIMEGYLGNQNNNDVFRNGYFLTGDIGFYNKINGESFFFLKGRSKEIIIKGGVNISPASVEDRLKQCDSAIDQVYVIGLPDRRYGEEVAAVVCWKKGEDAVKAEAKLRYRLMNPLPNIRSFEVPQYITTINASELPMTSTGKVQRSVIKKMIAPEKFRHVNTIVKSEKYEFMRLAAYDKPRMKEALELFNRCWQPLSIDAQKFHEHVSNGFVMVCVPKKGGAIESMISLLRTDLTDKELSKSTYDKLTGNLSMSTSKLYGKNIVCVSICSSAYVPQEPKQAKPPSVSYMEKYLEAGKDPVYGFHAKKKGGIEGAKLLSLLPNARPDDKLSLGYCMLLEYARIPNAPCIPESASPASQLIEAVMEFARQQDVERVFAFSRPAGASEYFSRK
ncbi:MAG: acyl--CoA ligase [Candidatus Aenigmarchaeota archaeon]|nr:acyl--CoA ligase [Candidatus Aenigmarchaeota archaeon]